MARIDKKSIIKYEDFQKIQILTGTIKTAEINKKARKPAYVLSIDFGPEVGIKTSSAQITNYSINELTEMFGQTEVEYIPARKGEYPFTLADYTKANQELGWTPTLDIKDYIKTKVK